MRLASRRGHRQVVRVLCERGANVDAKDEKGGVTPLLAAASENRVDVVAELLAHQPDLEVQARPHNMTIHGTALHHACDKGFVDVAALLCDAGANLEAATHISLCTPLLYACETGGPEMVRLLLSRGARSEARNLLRDTGLHLAARGGQPSHTSVGRLQLEHSPALLEACDVRHATPLLAACSRGCVEFAAMLLLGGANVEAADTMQRTVRSLPFLCPLFLLP